MTAEQAREIAKKSMTPEFDDILLLIKEQAEMGRHMCDYCMTGSPKEEIVQTASKLEDLGYKVHVWGSNQDCLEIKWTE